MRATLGEKHRPNERGTVLTDCHRADYVAKLGLKDAKNLGREMSSYTSKKSGASRSPMQIAVDFARYDDPADALLWMEACDILRHTQSFPCMGDVELPELDTVDFVDGSGVKDNSDNVLIASIDEFSWNRVRDVRFAPRALLKAARRGREAMEECLAELLERAPSANIQGMRRERRDAWGSPDRGES